MTELDHRQGGRLRLLGLIDLLAGLWLLAAPFALAYPRAYPHQRALITDLLIGALVAGLAFLHVRAWDDDRWASRGNLILGLLLLALPVLFGYGSDPAINRAVYNDVITGIVIIAGAALSLAGSTARPAPAGADPTRFGTDLQQRVEGRTRVAGPSRTIRPGGERRVDDGRRSRPEHNGWE